MTARTRSLTLGTVAALAVLAAAAQAATPPKAGARVTGTTSQGQAVKGRITSDGKGLQMTFPETFSCTGGKKVKLSTRYVNQRPTIKADGTVSYTKTYRDVPGFREFPDVHDERQRITGEFTDGGRRFVGRSTASLSKPGRTCRSTITLRLRTGS